MMMFLIYDQLMIRYSWTAAVLIAVIGVILGSFCNVIIYRLPLMIEEISPVHAPVFNLAQPGSFCPCCKNEIRWHDKIPVLSWFLLWGRCRYCRSRISFRYVFLEILFGVIAFLLAYFLGLSVYTICCFLFIYLIIALAFIDAESNYLPDLLLVFLFVSGVMFAFIPGGFVSFSDALFGSIFGFALLYLLALLFGFKEGRPAMYPGDFKYAAVLGWWFGFGIFVVLAFASGFAVLYFVCRKNKSKKHIAFGPWISLSAFIFFLFHLAVMHSHHLYLSLPGVIKNAVIIRVFI